MNFKIFSILFLLLFTFANSQSQTLKELEQRKQKTEQELQFSTELLEKTQKDRLQSVNQINILKRQLTLRSRLINELDTQIDLLENDIEEKTLFISSLNKDLENLKREYAKLIRFAQKNKTDMEILVFIFASEDFNQAYRRLRFYQQFIKFREKQAIEIEVTQKMIANEIENLQQSKNELEKSKKSKDVEVIKISQEQKKYQKSVISLRQREGKLRKEIEERKKSMELLDKAISDLIAEEAKRMANTKVRDGRYLKLSAGFEGNKGKLPWPTEQGIITSDFGEHSHPVLKGVKIKNNGVDISTQQNAPIKAIFDGEVKKIVSIPGSNMAVLIRHGDYLTVYSNITKVRVKVGDNVKSAQQIGQAYTDPTTGKGIYNLQIWHENEIQNPTNWILP